MNHKWEEAEKKLYTEERDSLDGSHEGAHTYIVKPSVNTRKKLDLKRSKVFKKGKSAVEGDQNSHLSQAKPMALDSYGD